MKRKLSFIFISVLSLFCFLVSCEQNQEDLPSSPVSSVCGIVRKEDEAAKGIKVLLFKDGEAKISSFSVSFTDEEGAFSFCGVKPGLYQVLAFSPFYEGQLQKKDVLVPDGENVLVSDFVFRETYDGKDGLNGKDGRDGADGTDGRDGMKGADGKNGTDGKDGVDGRDGKDGLNGKDGRDGADGKDGEDGKAGADGKSIVWLGSFSGFLDEKLKCPEELSAFYNTEDGSSWIYVQGRWTLLAKSGDNAVSLFVNFRKDKLERTGSSVLIKARVFHREEILEVSWLKGEFYNAERFFENPERVALPFNVEEDLAEWEVFENGIYSFGVTSADGKKIVETVSITNIDKTPPSPPADFSCGFDSIRKQLVLNWKNPFETDFAGVLVSVSKDGKKFFEKCLNSENQGLVLSDIVPDGAEYTFILKTFDDLNNFSESAEFFYKNDNGFVPEPVQLSKKHAVQKTDEKIQTTIRFSDFQGNFISGQSDENLVQEIKEIECSFLVFDKSKLLCEAEGIFCPETCSFTAFLELPFMKISGSGKNCSVKVSLNGVIIEESIASLLISQGAGFSVLETGFVENENFVPWDAALSLEEVLSRREIWLHICAENLDVATAPEILAFGNEYSFPEENLVPGQSDFYLSVSLPENPGEYSVSLILDGEVVLEKNILIYGKVLFSSIEIPVCGLCQKVRAYIKGSNFCSVSLNPDLFEFFIDDRQFFTDVEIAGSETLGFELPLPDEAGTYCVRAMYDGQSLDELNGNLTVKDYSSFFPGSVILYHPENESIETKAASELDENDVEKAVAVCIGFSELGIPLGLGLHNSYEERKNGAFSWAKKDSLSSVTKFEKLVCVPSQKTEAGGNNAGNSTDNGVGDDGTGASGENQSVEKVLYSFEGKLSGKNALSEIQKQVPEEASLDSEIMENLPALWYCKNYGENFGMRGELKNGWYLPGIRELYLVYENLSAVTAALSLCNGSPVCENVSGFYYSSSQDISPQKVYKLNFLSGRISSGLKTTSTSSYVLAVREFE